MSKALSEQPNEDLNISNSTVFKQFEKTGMGINYQQKITKNFLINYFRQKEKSVCLRSDF
jgi:hypothetical protein